MVTVNLLFGCRKVRMLTLLCALLVVGPAAARAQTTTPTPTASTSAVSKTTKETTSVESVRNTTPDTLGSRTPASNGELWTLIGIAGIIVTGWVVVEGRREATRRLKFEAKREERIADDSRKLLESVLTAARPLSRAPNETRTPISLVTAVWDAVRIITNEISRLRR